VLALTVLGVSSLKLVWFYLMLPSGSSQAADIEARRAYPMQRVASEHFGTGDMPSIVASPYREELAIATLSMTTVALTNLSFTHPDERLANRDAVRVMLGRILARDSSPRHRHSPRA
jgi:hypothetical protein